MNHKYTCCIQQYKVPGDRLYWWAIWQNGRLIGFGDEYSQRKWAVAAIKNFFVSVHDRPMPTIEVRRPHFNPRIRKLMDLPEKWINAAQVAWDAGNTGGRPKQINSDVIPNKTRKDRWIATCTECGARKTITRLMRLHATKPRCDACGAYTLDYANPYRSK